MIKFLHPDWSRRVQLIIRKEKAVGTRWTIKFKMAAYFCNEMFSPFQRLMVRYKLIYIQKLIIPKQINILK